MKAKHLPNAKSSDPKLGETFDTPYVFIAQALNHLASETDEKDMARFKRVTVNIWLGKGSHYLFNCRKGFTNPIPATFVDHYTDFCKEIDLLDQVYSQIDNVELTFKPFDCAERYKAFRTLGTFGSSDAFWDNCVDFEKGQAKPKIRVQNSYSYFNITNFARFERINFHGEDALA